MKPFSIHINKSSRVPRYRQIVDAVTAAISMGDLKKGDILPSVNQVMTDSGLSRDTVVKAYDELKQRGIVEAVRNKGFFVKGEGSRILLFFDTYSAFKKGLYDSFREVLPASYEIDMMFHHYNFRVFEGLLLNSLGKYNFWVVMSFENRQVKRVLNRLDPAKVLILDVKHNVPENLPYIVQNFDTAFYSSLESGLQKFRHYRELLFICPPELHHPAESKDAFLSFCADYNIHGRVLDHLEKDQVEPGKAYIVVSDSDLVKIVEKSRDENLVPGRDIGLVSYNDSPVKKIIGNGISVISTNFEDMGHRAARFVMNRTFVQEVVPTRLILRSSL
ncbi:MAG TPA: GntR family transcriptional regulator [Bacteroidales bacterium]|nr:GntR family transcriptional regulator [Bacteroidales bacterium]